MTEAKSTNLLAGVGAGRNRKPFVIKEWMFTRGLSQRQIAERLGLNKAVVSRTVFGSANNRKVLGYLRDEGCPAHALALPDDMREEAVA